MRTWRFWGALWAGKGIGWLLRFFGKKGTTLPGRIAFRIHPQMIRDLTQGYHEGIVIVTGTNGKTTTANLLSSILRTAGKHFAFNQAGANLVTGITGALLAATTWGGRAKVQMALFEVDEATVPKLCEQVSPDLAVITNFFRDQLDRYGELDTTVQLVKKSLPINTVLILNADDPLVAQFGLGRNRSLYYGVDRTPESQTESRETREARFCPRCGSALNYTLFHYGQLGIYRCPDCGFKRPQAEVLAEHVRTEEGHVRFRVGVTDFSLNLKGYYNLYNALAAITAAKRMGIRDQEIERGIRLFTPQDGRMERFALPGGDVTLTLVKNPTGFNQVLQTVFTGEAKMARLLMAINDLAADGRDISWLWDVNFELLGERSDRIREIICSGLRAEDMALRLKYAGVPVQKLKIEHSLERAVDLLLSMPKAVNSEPVNAAQDRLIEIIPEQAHRVDHARTDDLLFIFPTYTALFPMREILARKSLREHVYDAKGQTQSVKGQTETMNETEVNQGLQKGPQEGRGWS